MKNLPLRSEQSRWQVDLVIVLIVAGIFAIFSLTLHWVDKIYAWLKYYTNISLLRFIMTEILILLIGALWIAYRRWRVALAKKKELEDIIDSISPDVFMVVNPERIITMCNSSVKRMFGYDVSEVVGKKTDFLYLDRRTKPIHHHQIYNILEEEGFHIGTAVGKKKNGETIPLEIISGKLSEHRGAVILVRDITERNMAALELMQTVTDYELLKMEMYASLATYQTILDKIDDGIVVMNLNGIVHYLNPSAEQILGCKADEIVGKSIGFPVIQDEITEIEIVGNDNVKRTAEIRTTNIEWEGEPSILALIKDITELKRTEEKLEEIQNKTENRDN
ncbi:hypothetical protein DRQ33_06720 [bacterium]|nr:MAG: hypothetical protein DRQ33_06720 [bacterium]